MEQLDDIENEIARLEAILMQEAYEGEQTETFDCLKRVLDEDKTMEQTARAIYREGALHLLQNLELTEGQEEVEVTVAADKKELDAETLAALEMLRSWREVDEDRYSTRKLFP